MKLAKAWALNPDAPLTRAFDILSYVFKHAEVEMEKDASTEMLHTAELVWTGWAIRDAVLRSPSRQVQDRETALTDFLHKENMLVLL